MHGATGRLRGHSRPSEPWEEGGFSALDLFPMEQENWAGATQPPALTASHILHVTHLRDITKRLRYFPWKLLPEGEFLISSAEIKRCLKIRSQGHWSMTSERVTKWAHSLAWVLVPHRVTFMEVNEPPDPGI